MIELAIDFAGDTITIPTSFFNTEFLITGTGTLSAHYIITTSGTLSAGNKLVFYFKGTVDKDTYDFTILGTNLTVSQLNRESTITAVYNGSSWDLNIEPNTQAEEWLVQSDYSDNRNKEVIVVPVSFESGEQANNIIFVPYGFDLLDAWFFPTKTIAGTDAGTITIKGDTITLRTINVPASTAINTTCASVLVDSTQISPESTIECVTTKTTAGGKGLVSLVLQRYE